jgi:hypothetical protein
MRTLDHLRDRPYERAISVRKRTLAEGVVAPVTGLSEAWFPGDVDAYPAAQSTRGESYGALEWMASALTSVGVASCRLRNVRLK